MEYSSHVGMSKVYKNGKLVSDKEIKTVSHGDDMHYMLKSNDNIISGNINKKHLSEKDLMKLLSISKSNYSLLDRLKYELPVKEETKKRGKKDKKGKKSKSRKRRNRRKSK